MQSFETFRAAMQSAIMQLAVFPVERDDLINEYVKNMLLEQNGEIYSLTQMQARSERCKELNDILTPAEIDEVKARFAREWASVTHDAALQPINHELPTMPIGREDTYAQYVDKLFKWQMDDTRDANAESNYQDQLLTLERFLTNGDIRDAEEQVQYQMQTCSHFASGQPINDGAVA